MRPDLDAIEARLLVAYARELEAENKRLKTWRAALLDEVFGYDDSEDSAAEVLECAPMWLAEASADRQEVEQLQATIARVEALASTEWWEDEDGRGYRNGVKDALGKVIAALRDPS